MNTTPVNSTEISVWRPQSKAVIQRSQTGSWDSSVGKVTVYRLDKRAQFPKGREHPFTITSRPENQDQCSISFCGYLGDQGTNAGRRTAQVPEVAKLRITDLLIHLLGAPLRHWDFTGYKHKILRAPEKPAPPDIFPIRNSNISKTTVQKLRPKQNTLMG